MIFDQERYDSMKNEKLFRAFSEIDEALVAEADPDGEKASSRERKTKEKKPFFTGMKKWALPVVAACLLLAISLPMAAHFAVSDSPSFDISGLGNGNMDGGVSQLYPYLTGGINPMPSLPTVDKTEDGSNGPFWTDGEGYTEIVENSFVKASENGSSYFSIHANTASYTNLRSMLREGYTKIPKNAVRVEEMLNYFKYDYRVPEDGSILSLTAALFDTPYNHETKLLTVGLATEKVEFSGVANNIVFLIDTSGSMYSEDKLPLVQQAFSLLTENLNPTDRVSIVTYAGSQKIALSGAYGYQKEMITAAIEDLSAGGGTAGSKGIETAYQLAKSYFIEGGNNRVVLMTDGDFNVGVTNTNDLKELISDKRETGVYFSVYGVGRGNLQAQIMETLAKNGNGSYHYIDSVKEARRALAEDIGGSLVTVAKDVKAGITFDPAYVDSYRLIGYENNLLTQEEFENNETDAGELGSGHTVTVVYELKMTDKALAEGENIANVVVRYKPTENSVSGEIMDQELILPVSTSVYHETLTTQDAFIASVIEFALLLRESAYSGKADWNLLIRRLDTLTLTDEYQEEFRSLVKLYHESLG